MPQKLYHYTTIEKAIENILPKLELQLGNIQNVNDPLENLLHHIEVSTIIDSDYKSNMQDFLIASYIRKESKILCFTIDKEIDNKKISGFAFQRMWSQYGGSNTGVCIEIDFNRFLEENHEILKKCYHDKITYSDYEYKQPPRQLTGVIAGTKHTEKTSQQFWNETKHKDDFRKYFYFSKNIDWQAESEYRFLMFSEEMHSLSIKDSLCCIYFGLHFSKHYLPSIEKLIPNCRKKAIILDLHGNYLDKEI